MYSDKIQRTVVDFTTGWTLLNDFQYLPDDASKMEVVRQLFDEMTSDAHTFITKVMDKGINYNNIFNPAYPNMDLNMMPIVKNSDREPLGRLAVYVWGLMDYHDLFVKGSQAGSLSDDFPYALEHVTSSLLMLVSSPINKEITNLAMNALSSRHI